MMTKKGSAIFFTYQFMHFSKPLVIIRHHYERLKEILLLKKEIIPTWVTINRKYYKLTL